VRGLSVAVPSEKLDSIVEFRMSSLLESTEAKRRRIDTEKRIRSR
jgi:hypothetical protein